MPQTTLCPNIYYVSLSYLLLTYDCIINIINTIQNELNVCVFLDLRLKTKDSR